LLPAILIAAVSNLDNLAVGVAFGLRDTKITAIPNVIIAAVTMTATAAAMTSGRVLSELIPSVAAASLGSLIIIAIGAWTAIASLSAVRARTPFTDRRQL
jgi:putative Mn2+ efflux pump MntP